jgi:hypothetical protein
VVDGLAVLGEAGGAVRHQALALGGADLLAQVGLAGFAELALAAFRGVQRDHVIAHLDAGDALADGLDDAAAFMAEDAGEDPSGSAPERVKASVWQTPVATMRTRTSPALGGMTRLLRWTGADRAQATAALHLML